MKKRTVAIALVALLAVAAVPTIAFASAQGVAATTEPIVAQGMVDSVPAAQKAVEAASTAAAPACPGYVDADGDGVCDNYATGACAQNGHHRGYIDANNDGVCDNYASGACDGPGCGTGAGYVDANNDGICDNYAGGVQGNGSNGGNGQSNGYGQGSGYVDADGNGTCDNYEAGTCPGNGAGHGYGQGAGAGRGHHGRGC